ncbi:hypothetical protein ACTWPB_18945 [Nocardia sp. IBHARD005]|uniref:hypothetical protein n=1 Tax=Nocardia sp. IBHARD005 TaxID=3457765 RepID=UPI00405871B5
MKSASGKDSRSRCRARSLFSKGLRRPVVGRIAEKLDAPFLPTGTDAMVAQQQLTGQPVAYRTYPGVDHRAILGAGDVDALAWVNARFAR